MTTVREATIDLLRERGMTTIFGNPGSTELPMPAEFPDDFREYAILKWLAAMEEVTGAPGLDLPRLDVAGVAHPSAL